MNSIGISAQHEAALRADAARRPGSSPSLGRVLSEWLDEIIIMKHGSSICLVCGGDLADLYGGHHDDCEARDVEVVAAGE